jgi:putative tryptophan/tyrosine transport system substrate-binding protein
MKRRQFIMLIGGAAAAWPLAARAQQSSNKIPVVGVLWHAGSAEEEDVYLSVLVKAFNELGYVDGKNIHLDHRFPAENPDRFQTLAQELVDEKPDVIIAVTTLGAIDLKKTHKHHSYRVCDRGGPGGRGTCRKFGPPRRQRDRPLTHDSRLERKTFGTIEGSGSKPVPCRVAGRSD